MKWLDTAWWHGMETLLGLQCPADPEGPYRILRLRKDQHRIQVLGSDECVGQDAMLAALDKFSKLPIVLVLAETMVMERLLPADAAANPVFAVLGVGVGDTAEFEVMRFPADSNRVNVALIRKATLAAFKERLARHQDRVLTAIYTPMVSMYLLPQALPESIEKNTVLDFQGKKLAFKKALPCAEADLGGHSFLEQTSTDLAKAIGVQDEDILLYASLVYAWMQQAVQEKNMPLSDAWKNYQVVSRYRQIAIVASLVLFVWFACLASMRIQGDRLKSELEYAYSQNLPVLNAIQQLDQKIAARADLGNRLGSETLRPSRASYYLDRIAAAMPSEMHLTETIIGPDEEDLKRQGLREAQPKEIVIRGECAASAPIAIFSEALQKIEGIQDLQVEKSEMNFQSGMYEFIFLANIAKDKSPP